ncbi:TOBE domain-containing protein [uncultured Hydrogenophaga sp.]|uniref:TOBE domain-containing protein n=1 Tax=uncultured Hydrogenophaga sp. TaxID=199683 RepID=UPI00265F9429|nr:TOBE domain-containing protein [uncultured Hydrogenophaga sp.]
MPSRPVRPASTALPLADVLGHGASDKRIDILRRIGEAGSISEAARSSGVSYKAAWQALETLANLAGVPLVEKAVGGSGGGGARLTAAGLQVLQAADALQLARTQALAAWHAQPSTAQAVAGIERAALALRTSMRNQFPCRVAGLRSSQGMVLVRLEPAGAQPEGLLLQSRITRESSQLLGLAAGMPVLALCKATAVAVAGTVDHMPGRNLLQGVVTRLPSRREAAGEVGLQLADGLQLVGFAAAGHGLRLNQPAQAAVDESAVVLALPG